MQVMHCSEVQQAHATLAALTAEELALLREKTPVSVAKGLCFATTARLFAATACALWACGQAVRAVPRFVVLGCSKPFTWKTVDVYNRMIKTNVVQGVSFACAMVLPEVLYRKMQVERSLFVTQLQTLIETLPDYPQIPAAMTDHKPSNFFEPLAKLWRSLGFSDSQWRDLVQEELWKKYQENPSNGSQILELTSTEFRKSYLAPLCRRIAEVLKDNERARTEIDLSTVILLFNLLSEEVKTKIFLQRPEFAIQLEDEHSEESFNFRQVTNYRFRSQATVQKCNRLVEMMKRAAGELVKEGIYAKDDIEAQFGVSFHAVIGLGALYEIELDQTHALHAEVVALTQEEKRAIFQRLSGNEKAIKNLSPDFASAKIKELFKKVVAYRTTVVEHLMQVEGLRPEDTPNWAQGFIVSS